MGINFFWDWLDFGIIIRIYRTTEWSKYAIAFELQILWLNIWIQFWRRKTYKAKMVWEKADLSGLDTPLESWEK